MRWTTAILLLGIWIASLTTTANAATFRATSSATTCGGYFDSGISTNGDALFTFGSTTPTTCELTSFARVGKGFMSTFAGGDLDQIAQGGALAVASITENVAITTPAGANPQDLIPVAVVFSTDALLFANAPTNDSGAGIAVSSHRLTYSISGFNPGAGGSTTGDLRWEAVDDINNGGGNSLNVAPGLVVSNTIFIAPAGGLSLFFGVETSFQGAVQQFNPGVNGFADASNTASLATTGPAIILPDGFLVNAPDLGIVDNHWIDPRDDDTDGIPNITDNCADVANADQRDTDGDNIGNACDPDVNAPNDCAVNFADLNVYKANFFAAGDLDTDNNGDGSTNFADLNIVKAYFFGQPGPSANGCN